ncbi:L-lactate dehydrogenase complex protein LldF [Paracoccus alcaliphilus]|uniref:L-lactate dehydrogenase complex protein LldF n=1 Tax=Paracoccus alcaliphilus TaxID=34002 RepID=A0A1H8GJP1_9RHOB|nr:lactate utilization protein B [Paracoccus alcaliphilus]WCR18890.1 lactate utilization protein [Paracoccus alcaliphilus]SEN44212.1 L-lactate dehydrogenase complex protein LldF [Paracoccus alcaliphilus]
MQTATKTPFKDRARAALADRTLKLAIDRTTGTAETKRAAAVAGFPEFQAARERGRAIKDHVIANLGHYLEMFERNATASGAQVHWASDDAEARAIVTRICLNANAKIVTRSKSMLGEEIGLPHALADAGIERVETDLAEHIIQLAGEAPSHIIWPAMHRTREQVADLFREGHNPPPEAEDPATMVQSARVQLRAKFLGADVGISGANFLVADTGATCTVTNEGNAELTTTPPRIHIVTAGIEKIVPSTAHAFALLRLLVRSATGGEMTQYTTFHCGPKRPGDADGPEEMHIVLVDNGRTRMLADEFREMLRCIRCGACMNHCVVYRQIGGHAYGGTYPGPMGSVLTPVLDGLAASRDLPNACTMNGRCAEVCPVEIPLPTLLRAWRVRSWREGLEPGTLRAGIGLWARLAHRPRLYRLASRIGVRALRLFGKGGWISRLPLAGGWTAYRDLPRPPGRTFMEQYRARQKKGTRT